MTKIELIDYLLDIDENYTREELENTESKELLNKFLNWHGIIGFTDDIWDTCYNLIEPLVLDEYLTDVDQYKTEFEEKNLL